jgi:hypothetical protein
MSAPLLLCLLLQAAPALAASSDTVRMVELFLKAPTADLPPDAVPSFMAVDPASLPKRLRGSYLAKRAELDALKRLAQGGKKGYFRRMGSDKKAVCDKEQRDPTGNLPGYLARLGFITITEDDLLCLMQKTKCNECELQEEFSLTSIIVPSRDKGKGKPKDERKLLLHPLDPLNAIVGVCREGKQKVGGTDFFGISVSAACR